ncbi:deoxyribonuclease IV [Mycoplasma sp. SG1]|uniref:deoxyribonuclease IV n=1 Tax=Mycoplasma sp. SG1 TaxID=2810348 RepID=UPI0020251D8E|nr:deoxyribonuclease IV [Mycoplasma sp. SG1]URM53211.1 deoxyribonuclease IV [Mycoplasma sp. SG1]
MKNNYKLIIGSHTPLTAPDYLLGSLKFSLANKANCLMIYTGAPQNTIRTDINKFKIKETKELALKENFSLEHIIVHAPYIINLANPVDPVKQEFAVKFLKEEIKRTEAIGAKVLVVHPGSYVSGTLEDGLKTCIKSLNESLTKDMKCKVALETMAGKGHEICFKFEHLRYIYDNLKLKEKVGFCLDSCHLHDAGYDLINDLDHVIDEFDRIVGVDKVIAIHVNDSKNPISAHKDRHENLGHGHIGFQPLINFIYHPKLNGIPKILETPYIDNKPPYKEEIEMIRSKQFHQ